MGCPTIAYSKDFVSGDWWGGWESKTSVFYWFSIFEYGVMLVEDAECLGCCFTSYTYRNAQMKERVHENRHSAICELADEVGICVGYGKVFWNPKQDQTSSYQCEVHADPFFDMHRIVIMKSFHGDKV
jgi:hypothetical protein